MVTRLILVFLACAFALLPVVLPARQAVLDESAGSADGVPPEAAAVLELVKNLDEK